LTATPKKRNLIYYGEKNCGHGGPHNNQRETDRQTDRPQRDNQKHKSLRNEEFKAERGEEDAGEAEEC
jgi:hypothetical protein